MGEDEDKVHDARQHEERTEREPASPATAAGWSWRGDCFSRSLFGEHAPAYCGYDSSASGESWLAGHAAAARPWRRARSVLPRVAVTARQSVEILVVETLVVEGNCDEATRTANVATGDVCRRDGRFGMSTKRKSDHLTTVEMYHLDEACQLITAAFNGGPPYIVGTALASRPPFQQKAEGFTSGRPYRDVDVRLILDDEEFAKVCPTRARWELLCLSISVWLSQRTGLPVDFQIQNQTDANEKYSHKVRKPVGLRRSFAEGGDGVPPWPPLALRTPSSEHHSTFRDHMSWDE